jgi:hypothetical protein
MRQRAHGPEGPSGPGSPPRFAAGGARGPVQQTQAGRGPVLDSAQLEVLGRYGSLRWQSPSSAACRGQ